MLFTDHNPIINVNGLADYVCIVLSCIKHNMHSTFTKYTLISWKTPKQFVDRHNESAFTHMAKFQ